LDVDYSIWGISKIIAFLVIAIVFVVILCYSVGRSAPLQQRFDPLETVLLWWTHHNPFSMRSLINGGVLIFGISGCGKTNFSGRQLAAAIVRQRQTGGLIIAAKSSDLAMWREIFAAEGRSDDLRVFSPSESLRFNFLDYEMQSGNGQTRNVTRCIRVIGETLHLGESKGGEDGVFWQQQNERLIYNAVEILKCATGKVTAPDLQQFILGAATSAENLTNEVWKKGFHCQCLEAAHNAAKTPIDAHDCQMATDYWLAEFPLMPDKTRGSILAGVTGLLHIFNTGIVRELISGETNISPDDMRKGKFVLVDMAPSEWGEAGRFVCAGFKFLTQRSVLRREVNPGDCVNVIWGDEFHGIINSFDAQYIAECRLLLRHER
jgi:hypothetical protein